jgi:hypothetical protein
MMPVTVDWTPEDTARQAAYFTLHSLDWLQTRYIAQHPDEYWESNAILGDHPTLAEVNTYFIASGIAHYAISRWLPPDWRKNWQYFTLGVEAGYVTHNIQVGVGYSW